MGYETTTTKSELEAASARIFSRRGGKSAEASSVAIEKSLEGSEENYPVFTEEEQGRGRHRPKSARCIEGYGLQEAKDFKSYRIG